MPENWLKTALQLMLLLLIVRVQQCEGSCYFSSEIQGQYKQQIYVANVTHVEYRSVNITDDAIPIWGQCHRRIGNNVILMVDVGKKHCFRCFHVKLRSRNVLQINTASAEQEVKCWNETSAVCPSEQDLLKANGSNEIILFKYLDSTGGSIRPEYCPIHGRFSFTYDLNDGLDAKTICHEEQSYIDSCPSGSALNLHFRQCSVDNHDISFECLGQWEGRNNLKFLALYDNRRQLENRPQYRCAIYRDSGNGSVSIALSSDSTCTNNLIHASHGYETLQLTPIPQDKWPTEVTNSRCKLPTWLMGKWQDIIVNENTFLYKDQSSFKTYTNICLARSSFKQSTENDTRYSVFSRTQCGEETYNCLWIQKRSTNVLEFQMGSSPSSSYNSDLCSDANFQTQNWITQARLRKEPGECPVTGEYTGRLPDGSQLCAKLSSDCQSPDLMYYEVSDCGIEKFEQRQYKCLGQWEENGLLYTYTQRVDLAPNFYECFVGSIISDVEINIMEAGQNCQRMFSPLQYGMKLIKKATCYGYNPGPKPDGSSTTLVPITQHNDHWTPSAAPPFTEFDNGIAGAASCLTTTGVLAVLLFIAPRLF